VGEEAVRRGSYTGVDREGQTREFPITQLSAVILHVDPEHWASLTNSIVHLGSFVAEMKRQGKQSGPGSILMRTMEAME
jgi:hypothetical protein